MVSRLRLGAVLGSVALVLGATLFPSGGTPPERIPPAWCLRCGDLWLTDAIANVALFVPLGLTVMSMQRRVSGVVLLAFVLSTFVEVMQSIGVPPGRSAAMADIITNTLGATLGAGAWHLIRGEATRSHAAATRLALLWAALASMVFTLSARALQPYKPAAPGERLALTKSPFGHVPGHGWYEGINDSARVAATGIDTTVRQGWSGPIILTASADVLPVEAEVWVRGTDPLGGQIPLLFVHQAGDSAAWVQISKHGDDAELTVMRTAWKWGLTFPSVVVPNVFRARTVTDSSTVGLRAQVSSSVLMLEQRGEKHFLRVTPLLGWSLIQPIFTVQSSLAFFAHCCWICFWVLPVSWWARRSTHPRLLPCVLTVLIGLVLTVLPRLFGLATLSFVDYTVLIAALGAGAFVSSFTSLRRLSSRNGSSTSYSSPSLLSLEHK